MSIESLAIALHHSRAKGSARMVLVGIANHDGDGGAWPSVATLARYAGVSRSQVQRAIAQLEQLHEVRRYVQAGGTASMSDYERPNRYDFLLKCPADCDRSSKHRTANHNPVELDIDGPTDPAAPMRPGRVHAAPPAAPMRPKPPTNHPKTKTSKETHDPAARAKCANGHALVDDRHCTHGCPIKESAA